MTLITKVYKPSMTVGQVYARAYGTTAPLTPVGNVLSLSLSHAEDIKKQPDMTRGGGGTYAQTRRISESSISMELADWNAVNFARATFGTAALVAAGNAVDESHPNAQPGGLVRLLRPSPSAVTVKIGAATIVAAGNYEIRPEGIFVLEASADITAGATVLVSYAYPEHVNVEALTTSSPQIELSFGGLNEADSGKPVIVDVFRIGLGVAQQLSLIQDDFGTMSVEGEILVDPNKTGAGISRFYRVQMA